jgi:dTDP-glucose pyrophosphorylase
MKDFKKYLIKGTATVMEALVGLNSLSNDVQTLFAIDEADCLKGTLTDGDIRRALIAGKNINDSIKGIYNDHFRFICENEDNVLKIKECISNNVLLLPLLDQKGKIIKIYNLKKNKNILPVDAVLMAGGKGMRLRPLTENTPKPLLPIGEKAIIDYNIDNLISYGIDNINVTVNYLAEQIKEHFMLPHNDVQIKCIQEPSFLGTIGSVKFIPDFVNDTILVMNSDLFTDINLEDFYLHFKRNNAVMSAVAIPYSVNVPYGIFEVENRNIKGLVEKPIYNYYANAGIYLIKKQILSLIPDEQFFNATDLMSLLIEKNYSVIRYPHNGIWIDIGKPEDYSMVKEIVKHKTVL